MAILREASVDRRRLKSMAQYSRELLEAIASQDLELTERHQKQVACHYFMRIVALRAMEAKAYLPKNLTQQTAATTSYFDAIEKTFESLKNHAYVLFSMDEASLRWRYIPGSAKAIKRVAEHLDDNIFEEPARCLGWLYQYYQSDAHFAVIGKNALASEDIPAATQIFTPEWIAQFLVQNSLGLRWLEAHPHSPLKEKLALASPPSAKPNKTSNPLKPQDLRFFDPCLGAGHILFEAFDLLIDIYQSEGIAAASAVPDILEKNLFACDIDPLVASIAEFGLRLSARQHWAQVFDEPPLPCNIATIQSLSLDQALAEHSDPQKQLQTLKLIEALDMADSLGSLIECKASCLKRLEQNISRSQNLSDIDRERWQSNARALAYLCQDYDVVCTNPPYLNKLDADFKAYLKQHFKHYRNDLFSAFVKRMLNLCKSDGYCACLTPNVWLSLKSYEAMRKDILKQHHVSCLVQLARGAFFGEATVDVCAFVLGQEARNNAGVYYDLGAFRAGLEAQELALLMALSDLTVDYRYEQMPDFFLHLKGSPLAFNLKNDCIDLLNNCPHISSIAQAKQGMATTENARFLRQWYELPKNRIDFEATSTADAKSRGFRWFPYNKGGLYRLWYGNMRYVVDYFDDGRDIKASVLSRYPYLKKTEYVVKNTAYYFRPSLSWSKVSSGIAAFRLYPSGFIFDVAGCSLFFDDEEQCLYCAAFLNSTPARQLLAILSPTLNYETGQIASLPLPQASPQEQKEIAALVKKCVDICRQDWDENAISWDFEKHPILSENALSLEHAEKHYIARAKARHKKLAQYEAQIDAKFYALSKLSPPHEGPPKAYGASLKIPDKAKLAWSLIDFLLATSFGRYPSPKQEAQKAAFAIFWADANTAPQGFTTADDCSIKLKHNGAKQIIEVLNRHFPDETAEKHLHWLVGHLSANLAPTYANLSAIIANKFYTQHKQSCERRPRIWQIAPNPGSSLRICFEYLEIEKLSWSNMAAACRAIASDSIILSNDRDDILKLAQKLDDYAKQNHDIDFDDGCLKNHEKLSEFLPLTAL